MTAYVRAQQAGNLYEAEPMSIGNHEWRLVVFRHVRYGLCTTYQWRLLGSDEWRNEREWSGYNPDKWDNGLPARTFMLSRSFQDFFVSAV